MTTAIEQLLKVKADLEQQLKAVDGCIKVLQGNNNYAISHGTPGAEREEKIKVKKEKMEKTVKVKQVAKQVAYTMLNRGIRADIIRLLHTGPVSPKVLANELGTAVDEVERSLYQSVHDGLIVVDKTGLCHLTEAGSELAKLLVANPPKLKILPKDWMSRVEAMNRVKT